MLRCRYLLLHTLDKWINSYLENSSCFPKVTQVVRGRASFQNQGQLITYDHF